MFLEVRKYINYYLLEDKKLREIQMIRRISFRNDIQILRGIAIVISVILFHLDKIYSNLVI